MLTQRFHEYGMKSGNLGVEHESLEHGCATNRSRRDSVGHYRDDEKY